MCVFEVPFIWYSRQILDRLGIYGSLVLTFAGYTVRFIIYRCGDWRRRWGGSSGGRADLRVPCVCPRPAS